METNNVKKITWKKPIITILSVNNTYGGPNPNTYDATASGFGGS